MDEMRMFSLEQSCLKLEERLEQLEAMNSFLLGQQAVSVEAVIALLQISPERNDLVRKLKTGMDLSVSHANDGARFEEGQRRKEAAEDLAHRFLKALSAHE